MYIHPEVVAAKWNSWLFGELDRPHAGQFVELTRQTIPLLWSTLTVTFEQS
jgi:hypothetical protein